MGERGSVVRSSHRLPDVQRPAVAVRSGVAAHGLAIVACGLAIAARGLAVVARGLVVVARILAVDAVLR